MVAMSPNTVALSVLTVLKSVGRKTVPIDYVAESVNRSRDEVMPALTKLEQENVVHIADGNVTLR